MAYAENQITLEVVSDGATGATGATGAPGSPGAPGRDGKMLYATCQTEEHTTAKVATLSAGTLTLETGAAVAITFENGNAAVSPTLNVDNTGARSIIAIGENLTENSGCNWVADSTVIFIYDGTSWQMDGTASLSKAEDAQKTADVATMNIDDLDLFINGGYATEVTSDRSGEPAYDDGDVIVDKGGFYDQVGGIYGSYTFTYNGTNWTLNGSAVELNQYGMTLNATPQSNDTITVNLTEVVGSMTDINNQYTELSEKVDYNDEKSTTDIQAAQDELQSAIDATREAIEAAQSLINIVSTKTAGMGFTPENGLVLYSGDYAVTLDSVYQDEDISVSRETFCNAVNSEFGDYVFEYTDSEWRRNGSTASLAAYGITLSATPVEGDYITATLKTNNATDSAGFKLQLAAQTINFIDGALGSAQDVLAFVSGNALSINNAIIRNQLMLGNFVFIPRSNGNMALKYLG